MMELAAQRSLKLVARLVVQPVIRQRVQEGYNCGLRGRVRHLRKRIAHPVEVDDLLKRREEVAMPGGRGQFDVAER
ncbi:MAG: hypothetical protein WBV18_15460 [Methyloceanibacter sp.]|jgi:hypothetical protein|uniref:hypothetical protein n=1 Tax=Methyloceanibacter sp. TaxID=1965321 RepID=UPI003C638F33